MSSIPPEYHNLHEVFSKTSSNKLLEHGPSDMHIEFKEGLKPKNTGVRPMSPLELEELRRYLKENLDEGWIRRSKSPVSAPIVFAQKKDGSIQKIVLTLTTKYSLFCPLHNLGAHRGIHLNLQAKFGSNDIFQYFIYFHTL